MSGDAVRQLVDGGLAQAKTDIAVERHVKGRA